MGGLAQLGGGADARRQPVPDQRHEVPAGGEPGGLVVGDHALEAPGLGERRGGGGGDRQGELGSGGGRARAGEHAELPEHRPPRALHDVAGAGPHELGDLLAAQVGAGGEVGDVAERPVRLSLRHEAGGGLLADVAHVAEADPHRAVVHLAVGVRAGDARRQHPHAAPLGVADEAGGRVEAHRLRVEEGGEELGGVSLPQPGALVGEDGERRRVGLGEAEVGEADQLREDGPDRLVVDAAGAGAVAELLPEGDHRLAAALAAHRAAQRLRLAGGEAGERHRHLEHLLLEDHHAERLPQAVGQQGVVVGRLEVGVVPLHAPVLHVWVDGAAADRPGADEGDLDGEVVEVLGPGLQEALHLGAALDLEHADGVGVLDLGVDGRVGEPDAREVDGLAALAGDHVDALLDRRQHPQAEQVDLHEAGVGAGVLVPLADLPAGEGGGHDGDELHEGAGADDHAAGVLRQVPGRPAAW